MELISVERRAELLANTRDILKIELRDNYAIDGEHLAAWRSGGFPAIEAAALAWRDMFAADLAAGRVWRRVRVVSEPPSEYTRFAYDFAEPAVESGEDLRWLPRRLVSAMPLPSNDCFVLDGETAMFNVLDGEDNRVEIQVFTEQAAVKFCREAIEAAFAMATPHHQYRL